MPLTSVAESVNSAAQHEIQETTTSSTTDHSHLQTLLSAYSRDSAYPGQVYYLVPLFKEIMSRDAASPVDLQPFHARALDDVPDALIVCVSEKIHSVDFRHGCPLDTVQKWVNHLTHTAVLRLPGTPPEPGKVLDVSRMQNLQQLTVSSGMPVHGAPCGASIHRAAGSDSVAKASAHASAAASGVGHADSALSSKSVEYADFIEQFFTREAEYRDPAKFSKAIQEGRVIIRSISSQPKESYSRHRRLTDHGTKGLFPYLDQERLNAEGAEGDLLIKPVSARVLTSTNIRVFEGDKSRIAICTILPRQHDQQKIKEMQGFAGANQGSRNDDFAKFSNLLIRLKNTVTMPHMFANKDMFTKLVKSKDGTRKILPTVGATAPIAQSQAEHYEDYIKEETKRFQKATAKSGRIEKELAIYQDGLPNNEMTVDWRGGTYPTAICGFDGNSTSVKAADRYLKELKDRFPDVCFFSGVITTDSSLTVTGIAINSRHDENLEHIKAEFEKFADMAQLKGKTAERVLGGILHQEPDLSSLDTALQPNHRSDLLHYYLHGSTLIHPQTLEIQQSLTAEQERHARSPYAKANFNNSIKTKLIDQLMHNQLPQLSKRFAEIVQDHAVRRDAAASVQEVRDVYDRMNRALVQELEQQRLALA